MARRLLLFLAALVLAAAAPVCAIEVPVSAFTLRNGLRILIHEDHSAPVVSSYVFFRSGSRNEQLDQTGPQQHVIVGYDDAHGRSISMLVPPPGGLATRIAPPTVATRSAIADTPVPPMRSAPPMPSSVISIRIACWVPPTVTDNDSARACFMAFVNASAIAK